nr:zinc finger, CCHC-type [Tanacetum cinerariifolium]
VDGSQEVQTHDLMDYQLARDKEQHLASYELFGYREDSNEAAFVTLLEGHSILSLEGSLSGDCDVEKNGKWSCIYAVGSQEYHMVYTRLDIASVYVGMLDKFDRGLQTDVQVFVDFDYAMERSITVMESRYELRLVPCIATGCLDECGTWTQTAWSC